MNENNNAKSEWTKRDVGALWKREGKNQNYLSGYVKVDELGVERELKIVVFSNKNKNNNSKAPDYRIYVSKPVEGDSQSQVEATTKKPKAKSGTTKVSEEVKDDLL